MIYNKEHLVKFLIEQWQYIPAQAPVTADKLEKMDKNIIDAFEQWLETGEFSDSPVFSGYNPKILSEKVTIKPPAVFLLLDWIRREPIEALRALNQEYGI